MTLDASIKKSYLHLLVKQYLKKWHKSMLYLDKNVKVMNNSLCLASKFASSSCSVSSKSSSRTSEMKRLFCQLY